MMLDLEMPETVPVGSSPESFPVVRVRGLTKAFRVRRSWWQTLSRPFRTRYAPALRSVDFSVSQGECFGILGPNGAGKTTLFKILATLIRPDDGTAMIGGYDIRRDPKQVRRWLSPVIPEERSLNWRVSGAENLRLFAAIHRVPRELRLNRVAELLETVGLADAGHKIVAEYSSGMKQRLLIARALIPRPRILLLDEPTRSLDPIATRSFWDFVKTELISAQGCTVLIATHNPEEALALCNRIAVMSRGKLAAIGAPSSLLAESAKGRYRLLTTDAHHSAFSSLGLSIVATQQTGAIIPGWTQVELEIEGGPERAAEVNRNLVESGVLVANFERKQKSLSEYITEVVDQNRD